MTCAEPPSLSSAFGPLDGAKLDLSLEALRLLERRCHTPEPTPPTDDDDEDEEDDDRGSSGGNIDPDDEEGDFDDEDDDDDETLWTVSPHRVARRTGAGDAVDPNGGLSPRPALGRGLTGSRDGYR